MLGAGRHPGHGGLHRQVLPDRRGRRRRLHVARRRDRDRLDDLARPTTCGSSRRCGCRTPRRRARALATGQPAMAGGSPEADTRGRAARDLVRGAALRSRDALLRHRALAAVRPRGRRGARVPRPLLGGHVASATRGPPTPPTWAAPAPLRAVEIAATDYHTAGEPFRIVTAGVPADPRRFGARATGHCHRGGRSRAAAVSATSRAATPTCTAASSSSPTTRAPTSACSSGTRTATRRRAVTGRSRWAPGPSSRAACPRRTRARST